MGTTSGSIRGVDAVSLLNFWRLLDVRAAKRILPRFQQLVGRESVSSAAMFLSDMRRMSVLKR